MIISFDIDNTLIPYSDEFETYQQNIFGKILGVEPLRLGTKELFQTLHQQDFEIWIYTTSYRSTFSLIKTFWFHGLHPHRYINQPLNQKRLSKHQCSASKNPKLFGIDIHIDDLKGVELEGQKYDFQTIIIHPKTQNWVAEVLNQVKLIQNQTS